MPGLRTDGTKLLHFYLFNLLIFLYCEEWGLEDVDYPNFIREPVKSSKRELSFVQVCCLSPDICICFVVRIV